MKTTLRTPSRRIVLAGAALILASTWAASAQAQNTKIRFQLDWRFEGPSAIFLVAEKKGYFKEEKLDVTIDAGNGSGAAVNRVASGAYEMGFADLAALMEFQGNNPGAPNQPMGVMMIYNNTPAAVFSLKKSGIKTPKDLEGKKIAVSVGDTVAAYLGVICKMNEVDCNKIDRVMMDSQVRSSQFLANRVDALTTYLNVDPPLLASISKDPLVTLDFSKFGLVLPGLSIVVKDDAVAKKGKPLSDFLAALDEGVAASRKDPAAAAQAIRMAWPGSPKPDIVQAQVSATLDAIPQLPGRPAGYIEAKDLSVAIDMLKSVGELQGDKPVDAYYSNALFAR